jgi:ABC-type glutathione transport system ATPase component
MEASPPGRRDLTTFRNGRFRLPSPGSRDLFQTRTPAEPPDERAPHVQEPLVASGAATADARSAPRADELVGLDMTIGQDPHEFSAGHASASASHGVITDPEFVLCDEPFPLDPVHPGAVDNTPGPATEAGADVLFIAHDLAMSGTSPTQWA